MSSTETINQFLNNTTNYEKKHTTFFQSKDRMFQTKQGDTNLPTSQIEQKTKLKQQDQPHDPVSETDVITKGLLKNIQIDNYIIKASSIAQIDEIILNHNVKFEKIIAVDFSNIKMAAIQERLLIIFPSIQILNLQNNLISEIPPFIHQLELIQLNVNNNLIKQISIQGTWMRTMERLDIGKNHIRFLPEQLYEMKMLSILDIRSNDFTCLHSSILCLKDKIQALGIDWVKYDFHIYYKNRQDILANQQLDFFWEVIMELISNKQSEYIQCFDFIQIYNSRMPQEQQIKVSEEEDEEGQPLQIRSIQMHGQVSQQISQPIDLDSEKSQQTIELSKPSKRTFLIHYAVMNEDLGMLRTLIDNDLSLTTQLNEENHTPLSLAIYEEKYHCAKILLSAGADINIGGGTFGSCLNIAITKIQYFLIRDLLQYKCCKANLNRKDRLGNGPLHLLVAVFKRNKFEASKIGQLLLEGGAEPNLFNDLGLTPIQLAIKKGLLNAIEFFLTYNCEQKQQYFSLKMFTQSRNSSMHLAAYSENITVIMLIYKLYPFQLFLYNCKDQRPLDIIQKNYTLSKLFQALEVLFMKNFIHRPKTAEQEQIHHHLKSKSFQAAPLMRPSDSSSLYESDEDNVQQSIKHGMALMNFQVKVQKNPHLFESFLDRQDSKTVKFKDSNKVPSEKARISTITRSIQQDRNDINKIEQQNRQLQKSFKSLSSNNCSNNKQIHQTLKDILQIYKDLKFHKIDMAPMTKITQILLFEKCVIQLESMKQDPIMKYLIENAQELQNFGNDLKITEWIKEEKDKLSMQVINLQEQEQVINFGYKNCFNDSFQKDNSFIQYECLQRFNF